MKWLFNRGNNKPEVTPQSTNSSSQSTNRMNYLRSQYNTLEEKNASLVKVLDSSRLEALDWKRKYEQLLSKQKVEEDQLGSEIATLRSRCSATEARLAAAQEKTHSAQEEAGEWKRKYDVALEKASVIQECSSKKTQEREDALRAEFSITLAKKDKEIKEKAAKIEHADQCMTTLNLELKAAESKMKSYDVEISTLKYEIKELHEQLEAAKVRAQSFEREGKMLDQQKQHLEEKYQAEFSRFDEVQERCRIAEREAKRATELADKACAEAVTAQEEKNSNQALVMEKLALIEKADMQIENLERQKIDLANEVERLRESEMLAHSKAEKDKEIKEKAAKIEHAYQCMTTLNLELKAAESKMKSYDVEISTLKYEIKELHEQLEAAKGRAQSFEREAKMLDRQKQHLEEKYLAEFSRFDEVQERCCIAEREAKRATELADKARAEAVTAQEEKNSNQALAMEKLALIERAARQIEKYERQKTDLVNEVERLRESEMVAHSKVELLEARVEEWEKEIDSLLKSNNEQRVSTVHVLENLLQTERAARAEANSRAEALSLQLQSTQARLHTLQQELTLVRLNETALDSKLRTASHGKRNRTDWEMGMESVHEMDGSDKIIKGIKRARSASPLKYSPTNDIIRGIKRARSASPLKYSPADDGGSTYKSHDDTSSRQTSTDHTEFSPKT